MIKKPNQRLHRVEWAGIKFKLIKGPFKEIIAGGKPKYREGNEDSNARFI